MSHHALVIGAGLAGTASASALVHKGWRVSLLESGDTPACAASALPVGILSPLLTRAPTTLSRLSELGAAAMHKELARLLPEGQGWQSCQIQNLGHAPGQWPAAMVQPSVVIDAWLKEARATGSLETRLNTPVDRLSQSEQASGPGWEALDANGQVLCSADAVVLAGAWRSVQLLKRSGFLPDNLDLFPLRPVKGQMSFASLYGTPLAANPMRNNGVFVPDFSHLPRDGQPAERIWAMGSTYERGADDASVTWEGHLRNLTSLRALSTQAAATMAHAMEPPATLRGWAGVRCASLDRVPLIGQMPDLVRWAAAPRSNRGWPRKLQPERVPRLPGFYVLTALGSRGLTLAHWAGKELAALISGSTMGFEADLQLAVDPARFGWRQLRQQIRPV
ncbi:FAD-dependent oxidoreductase [Hydrogenophaga sp. 5NK40-0174]|uniref:FAD-dependent oxidoreductase n=1 Tax=Hydrogenophaga sp. 5NK40-0174 TaxID=3127649 RepID=UPI003108DDF6